METSTDRTGSDAQDPARLFRTEPVPIHQHDRFSLRKGKLPKDVHDPGSVLGLSGRINLGTERTDEGPKQRRPSRPPAVQVEADLHDVCIATAVSRCCRPMLGRCRPPNRSRSHRAPSEARRRFTVVLRCESLQLDAHHPGDRVPLSAEMPLEPADGECHERSCIEQLAD